MPYSYICITNLAVVFEFYTFQMSMSGIRRKHAADAIQLRRISRPASPTFKEGPSGRANRRAMHNSYKERYQGPHVSLPEKDKDERWPGGASRPPVQVHFEEESAPSLLITFRTCIWREPTSTSINRAPSQRSHTHTHTSFHSLQEGSPLSCSLS